MRGLPTEPPLDRAVVSVAPVHADVTHRSGVGLTAVPDIGKKHCLYESTAQGSTQSSLQEV